MPIYEYAAKRCERQPPCSCRKEYLQNLSAPALTACKECGAPISKILSTFAARSGEVGVSTPDPTPLNVTGMAPPPGMTGVSGMEGVSSDGHSHEP